LAADFVQTLGQVFLLPLPVDVVDLGVVEVEEGLCGRGTLECGSESYEF
jgi:metal-sulfur cluster biosynthetic enzyme